jgi:capsular polysaccharide transport system permease protein
MTMRGLLIQLQVIHALLLREVKTRFGKHHLGYGWALLEPVLWIATFLALYHVMGRAAPPGMSVLAFLVTGIVPFGLFRNASQQTLSAIAGNKGLLFYPQVRPLDLVFSRGLLETVTQFVVFILLMGGAALVDGKLRIDSVLVTLLGLSLAAGLGVSLGLVLCGLSVLSPAVERIHAPLLRPLFWVSAIFYSVEATPQPLRNVILYNPVAHAIELVRDGWFEGYQARYISAWYPASWVLVLLFFGLSLERVARRRLELT